MSESPSLIHRGYGPPFPGCLCPAGYVRDVCSGHPARECPFHGVYGRELARAHWEALHPDGQQLELGRVA